MTALPADFLARLQLICPPDLWDSTLASFSMAKQTAFRLNGLGLTGEGVERTESVEKSGKSSKESEQVVSELKALGVTVHPVDWCQPYGIDVYQVCAEHRERLTHSAAASDGRLYIQSLSSMLAPLLLAPKQTDWVLDLAAAPGGKTILLAELMRNEGKISAVEPVKSRFFRLQANLERMGVSNTRCYLKDGRAIGSLKPESFDRILLDAPCSSESRFRLDQPESLSHWSLAKVAECARKQKRLIKSAWEALKPGGRLVYCTCSFAPEENELIVHWLLRQHPEAHVLPIVAPVERIRPGLTSWQGKALSAELSKTLRVWPDTDWDGFYLALLEKPL